LVDEYKAKNETGRKARIHENGTATEGKRSIPTKERHGGMEGWK
jgi:hypothetical protein